MSDAPASRIRWDQDDLAALATEMAAVLHANPGTHLLAALRTAQEKVLKPERQREIKAWSVVEGRLGSLLRDAQVRISSGLSSGPVDRGEPADPAGAVAQESSESLQNDVHVTGAAPGTSDKAGQGLEAGGQDVGALAPKPEQGKEVGAGSASLSPMSDQAAARGMAREAGSEVQRETGEDEGRLAARLAGVLEAALLVALQSPAIEDAFTKVLGRAMGRATAGKSETGPQEQEAVRGIQRVLVAGFPGQMAKGIESELRGRFDVRSWTPGQGPHVFDTLTRLCSVAVIPEEAEDEMSETLKQRDMQVVRHAGSPQKLVERLSTMLS